LGTVYEAVVNTNSEGFRMFGDLHANPRKKILFIGDSYTHAHQVSNDKTYYGILAHDLPMEVFAYGVDGYGTLQEYLVIDRYLDLIQPDILVLQYCSNDFINNAYELEVKSVANNNGMRRPYLTSDNEIVYALPKQYPRIRHFANASSRFMYSLFQRIDALKVSKGESVEARISKQGTAYPAFKQSVRITNQVLKLLRQRVPATTAIYAFGADDSQPYSQEFKHLALSNGIQFIEGVPQAVRKADKSRFAARAPDHFHWNELGHKIVAETLRPYLLVESEKP
jgi:hypothetical protein